MSRSEATDQVDSRPRICQVLLKAPTISETFLRAHAEGLPARVTVVYGMIPHMGGRPVLSQSIPSRVWRKLLRQARGRTWDWEITSAYIKAFKNSGAEAVLAEYGPVGVMVLEACEILRLPLIVHFHGYDASIRSVLEEQAAGYQRLFRQAAAIIAVSKAMREKLIALGAPAQKVFHQPCGVDDSKFGGADPEHSSPTFVAIGRLIEKKAPYLTVVAFATVCRQYPDARLRIIGDGPLLNVCRDLARALGVEHAVTFLGPLPHERVQQELRDARAFVQHSVEADGGDSEGTPVSVLEAGATGLPVVSTLHAGIPDVVLHGETGFLVPERDVDGMASMMTRLLADPALAARLGRAARARIQAHYSLAQSNERLWKIIETAMAARSAPLTAAS